MDAGPVRQRLETLGLKTPHGQLDIMDYEGHAVIAIGGEDAPLDKAQAQAAIRWLEDWVAVQP